MKKAIKIIIFMLAGLLLIGLVYKDYDFNEIKVQILNINYFWLLATCFFVVISHVSRSVRWQIMIKTINYKSSSINAFFSVIISYFASLAIPRAGEIARCVYIKKYEKIPVSTTLGTVVSERIVDMTITILMTLFVALTSYNTFITFITTNFNIPISLLEIVIILIIGIASLVFIYIKRGLLKRLNYYKKIEHVIVEFKEGIVTILKFKNKYIFVGLSLLIWLSYFMSFYCCTQCFSFTENLGLLNSFTIFVLATYGVLAPTPAGIGAWHFIVIVALQMFIPDIGTNAGIFALFTHSVGNIIVIIIGFSSMVLAPIINKE